MDVAGAIPVMKTQARLPPLQIALFLLLFVSVGCGREARYSETNPGPLVDGGQDFSHLDQVLDEAMEAGLDGFAMQVVDVDGRVVFRRQEGQCRSRPTCPRGNPDFDIALITGVASSSKWVTSTTLLAALDEGVAAGRWRDIAEALDDGVVEGLSCAGEAGPFAELTLRQLLSFTSGVLYDHDCIGGGGTLERCGCQILEDSVDAYTTQDPAQTDPRRDAHPPGTTYKYGPAHHVVAAAGLEAVLGESFQSLFERLVVEPLDVEMGYSNELNLAGSLETSVIDYTRFVDALRRDLRGVGPVALLSPEALLEQRSPQVPEEAVVLISPSEHFAYGLNVWRFCTETLSADEVMALDAAGLLERVDPTCAEQFVLGHSGKWGYTPFVDEQGRYGAVLSVRQDSAGLGDQYDEEQVLLSAKARLLVHAAMTQ
jgi:CubicO group peptidase (beta-lactamase class C family)